MPTELELNLHVDQPYARSVQPGQLERALHLTLQAHHQTRATTINLTITTNEIVQQLNGQYRGIDSPTDVLSFPNVPDPDFPLLDQDDLGDIIIAYPVAEFQAKARGHTPQEEVVLLAIHGALHLLGFDHDTPAAKAEMWTAQQAILAKLGLDHVQPTET